MVSILRVRLSRIINVAIFFVLTFIQIIIVSWISISYDNPKEEFWKPSLDIFGMIIEWLHERGIFGFYVSINPFIDPKFTILGINIPQFTVLLLFLTAGLQLLLLAFLVNIVFSNKNMIQIYPEPLYGPAYAPEETPLVEKTISLVTRVSKKVNIEVTKIFVYRKAVPNAFSLDLLPIPFFRRPYLVLNTNVLEILSEQEIEAVIAHELAHVKNSDSLVRLVLSIPRLFLSLVYLFIYLQILTGILDALFNSLDFITAIWRLIFLGLVYLILAIATRITVRFLYAANHQAEYLADYFAATLVGSDVLINSLIRLGQRGEAMQALSREIEWLTSLSEEKKPSNSFLKNIYQRFPKTQLDEDHAREIAPRIFLEEKFEELVKNYSIDLDLGTRTHLINSAVPSLLKRRAEYFALLEDEEDDIKPSVLKAKTIDWRRFDSDASQTLEEEEIDSFIATLLAQPDKMVFEHELFQTIERDNDHPGFRGRILNVYRMFHADRYKKIVDQLNPEKKAHNDHSTES
ncbi:MAG: M48 family metalloprotease [Candidatus Heimdallarchaeota archaeon]|nr:MAG: M48 family metalloprotease [Candidatus Heimdallarchaeota archaeon]